MGRTIRVGKVTLIEIGETWHYRFQVAGKRIQRSTREPLKNSSKAEQLALAAYEVAKLRARGEEPEPTLEEAVRLWVQSHALSKSSSHIANIERFGRLHLFNLGQLRLTQLSTALVEEARQHLLRTHHLNSANQWLTYLRLICHWAIRRRMIRTLPFDVTELKTKKTRKPLLPRDRVADWLAEVDAITAHEPSIGLILRLQIGLGLRGSEARLARWEWLDWDRGTYTPGDTKGGEAWARPVPEWLLAELKPKSLTWGWMVPTLRGGPATHGRIQRVIDAACEAVGIPRFTAHRLRATYATWLADEGVPIQNIKNALGHKDIKTTEGYLAVDMRGIAEAQKRIAARTGMSGLRSGNQSPRNPHPN